MNIRVDLNIPINDGKEVVFRSPVDCSQVTGLIVYYPENGNTVSKEFAFADAHGNNVGDIDHLFTEDVVVKVILDVTKSMAFVQNADTNAYLEGRFAGCANVLKGPAVGKVVGIDDASPFEQEMSVKLSSEAITDFSNVKVRKYPSKNYAPYERVEFERVDQTFVFNEPLEVGKTYRFTADLTSTFDGKCVMSLVPGGQQLFVSQGIGATITFDVPNVGCTGFWLYSAPTWSETVGHTAIYDRISVVEECTPTEHTPTADGIVSGIISNGEPMTFITDNANVTITAEYNKDTNKVIERLVQAIVSLGGNV